MENEAKKKHRSKNRHSKHKSYFIEPAQKNEAGSTRPDTATEGSAPHSVPKPSDAHSKERHNSSANTGSNVATSVGQSGEKKNRHGRDRNRRNRHKNARPDENRRAQSEQAEVKEQSTQIKKKSDTLTVKPIKEAAPQNVLNEADYEEIHFPASEETALSAETHEDYTPSPMVEVVGIRFKSSGKVYYFAPEGKTVRRGEYAIVETARGQEYGEVAMGNTMVKESDTVPPLRPIVRVATDADKQHHQDNKKKEDEAFKVCNEKIIAHELDMKLIDAQYTFDNSKLLFYFTSSGRVDFRDLVKDLASVFRTRIELRQIGIRDEAKLMGGMGMCGRPLCCSIFLSDFGQVSIKMAKEQNLSLNSAKISGICGRLMCCLRYEHDTYEYEIKRTPPVDSLVRTADGIGTVTEISPLVGTVKVRLSASPDTPPKVYRREDVVMLKKKQNKESKDKGEHQTQNSDSN